VSEDITSNRSWQQIVAFYDDLVLKHHLPYQPMRDLVRRLAESPGADDLERNTSMHTLLVSNAPARSWHENVLGISFLPNSQEFEFEYRHYDGDTNTSKKCCSVPKGWDTLSRFIRYKFGTLLPDDSKT
jgi:hypothetical protein